MTDSSDLKMADEPMDGDETPTCGPKPYGPITKGLRDYAKIPWTTLSSDVILNYCDNIDAIHRTLEDENATLREQNAELRETVAEHARSNVEAVTFLDRLSDAVEKREEVTILGVDYAPLPLDADGMPVHVGDMMDTSSFGTVEVEGFVHSAIAFYNYEDPQARLCTSPAKLCHHRKPTVVDVLRELWDESHDDLVSYGPSDRDAIIERYAKRLQLAEVDE